MKTLKFWNLFENFIILKFHEIFEILWKFCIYYKIFEILKFLENFELLKKFWIFWRFWLFFVYCMRITISRISLVWFNHVVMIWENLFIFSNMLYDHAICYFLYYKNRWQCNLCLYNITCDLVSTNQILGMISD